MFFYTEETLVVAHWIEFVLAYIRNELLLTDHHERLHEIHMHSGVIIGFPGYANQATCACRARTKFGPNT